MFLTARAETSSHSLLKHNKIVLLSWEGLLTLDWFLQTILYPVFPIWAVSKLKGQPKRDDGMIVRSCKGSFAK